VLKAVTESLDRAGRLEERVQRLEKALARTAVAPVPAHPGVPTIGLDLRTRILAALHDVIDPEAGVNVMEMGLVHDVIVDNEDVEVQVRLDNPQCPLVEYLVEQIQRKAHSVNGTRSVQVTLLEAETGGPAVGMTEEVENYVG